MLTRVYRWVDDRWPLSAFMRSGREEEIRGGSSFAFTLGSALLFVFFLQTITGIWQLFYYVPTVDHAYDSLDYLRTQVPFGWLIHGLHYWGANTMVVLVFLHMSRVFIWGAYKPPRELTWLTGVCLLLITMGLSFTGAPLPWDQRGYWAVEVGTGIAGTLPIFGDLAERLMRGGPTIGQLTLSRFFVLHAVALPGVLIVLIGAHLLAFRRFGSVGPWDPAKGTRLDPFWPNQVAKDALVITFLFLLLIALSVYAPPPFTGPADPLDTSFVPKPEWNFLFLYETLKFFPGRLEPVGTVGIPTVLVLVLVLLPFLDRRGERRPLRRLGTMLSGLILAGILTTLTIAGFTGGVRKPQTSAVSPPVGSVAQLSKSARRGAQLFESVGCIGCHRINGTGGTIGPDLSYEVLRSRTHQWLVAQIRNPEVHDPRSSMPSFASLQDRQVNALVDYLLSLAVKDIPSSTGPTNADKVPQTPSIETGRMTSATSTPASSGPPGRAADIIGSARRGNLLFERNCASCHGNQGGGNIANPGSDDGTVPVLNPVDRTLFNQEPQVFAENVDRIIQHGAISTGPNPTLRMPAFGDTRTLTQPEIANIEAYILRLNGVDRGQRAHAGVDPHRFFQIVLTLFGLAGVGLGGFWIRIRQRQRRQAEGPP